MRLKYLEAVVLVVLVVCLVMLVQAVRREALGETASEEASQEETAADEEEAVPEETPAPEVSPLPEFKPERHSSDNITGTTIVAGGEVVDSYEADAEHVMDFAGPEDYAQIEGIVTFRGNNFRNTSSYGTVAMDAARFGDYWEVTTGALNGWTGSGWTGQPLAVKWPKETKQIMNMKDWAKEKDDLIEVIYATLAGKVYFIDLETGEETRDSLYLGYPFKGAGSLDPRGYPLMYLGGGVNGANGGDDTPKLMVVSLIDGEVLYTTGTNEPIAPRGWTAWDSSPLVDAETDQLIYPCENGVLYILDLNTWYDPAAGTIEVRPEEVKFTYSSPTAAKWYYGMEDSAIAWRGHLFVADNGANFLCIDLNTLEIEWRFDCLDDTNCTGVLELDDTGHPYIYMSTSFHNGWRSSSTAEIPVWKIDAVTGQEVWHHSYDCHSLDDLSGGCQGSLSLGTGPLEGILYVAMARYPSMNDGNLLALDAKTGEELWTYHSTGYSWSTPVTFYDTDGNGYVLYTDVTGPMYMLDGRTGEVMDTFDFESTMEATPIVYGNTIVIGTRDQHIYGIRLG